MIEQNPFLCPACNHGEHNGAECSAIDTVNGERIACDCGSNTDELTRAERLRIEASGEVRFSSREWRGEA